MVGRPTMFVRLSGCDYRCLRHDSVVTTESGHIRIELVKEGDRVLSWNESTNQSEWSTVLQVFDKWVDRYYEIPTRVNGSIWCTGDHPFSTRRGWVEADKLCRGDTLRGIPTLYGFGKRTGRLPETWERVKPSYDRHNYPLESRELLGRRRVEVPTRVYNLRVQGNENFFVNHLLVHNCSWCDTPYAVYPDQFRESSRRLDTQSILDELRTLGPHCKTVTLSGGNPCLQDCRDLVETLTLGEGYFVALETQGSRWRDWVPLCSHVTVSPKPPSSGIDPSRSFDSADAFLRKCRPMTTTVKVVIFTEEDYEFALLLHREWGTKFYDTFYLQPGSSLPRSPDTELVRDAILDQTRILWERVANDPLLRGVRVVPQLHSLVYGNRRGV